MAVTSEAKPVIIPLNPYMATMVKPEYCIRGNTGYVHGEGFRAERCTGCQFLMMDVLSTGMTCVYKEYEVIAATGSHVVFDKDWLFLQWCCANCGELLCEDNYISYVFEDLHRNQHVCKHCGTIHIHLRTINNDFYKGESLLVFAVPVKTPVRKKELKQSTVKQEGKNVIA